MVQKLRVFHQIQIAYSALFRAADRRTRTMIGLTTSQFAVLFVLSQSDGQPISEIAKRLSMGKSSLTGLVDRMAERGVVCRRPCPNDRRVTNIYLEPEGRAVLQQGKAETKRFNKALLDPFDESEQQVIHRFLSHLAGNADAIINPPETKQETDPSAISSAGQGEQDD